MSYETATRIEEPFDETLQRVREELAAEGFGVLTEIDVQRTLYDRLGVPMEDYVILGACNPELAHQALETERSIGVLLPCNVVVRSVGGRTCVEYVDPHSMVALTRVADLEPVAEEATTRLRAMVHRLQQPVLPAASDPAGA